MILNLIKKLIFFIQFVNIKILNFINIRIFIYCGVINDIYNHVLVYFYQLICVQYLCNDLYDISTTEHEKFAQRTVCLFFRAQVIRFVRSFQQHPKNRSSAKTMLVKNLLYS